jgi:ABC-type phosphate/phosphonate transport system permease subunit
MMRRVVILTLLGAVVFSILTTWLGPKMIGWYVTPADQPAALSCQAAVVGAMHRLVQTQLIGTALGAVVGLILGVLLRPRRVPPPATPPPAKPV